MNREIKFRGLRTDGNGWAYGTYLYTEYNNAYKSSTGVKEDFSHMIYPKNCDGKPHEVIPESIGQYTGLKDKNGVEIYEGDWLQCPGYACKVEFLDGGFHTIYTHPEDPETLPILDVSPSESMTVVGNIHQP